MAQAAAGSGSQRAAGKGQRAGLSKRDQHKGRGAAAGLTFDFCPLPSALVRKRPLRLEAAFEFLAEEGSLHPSVDDVPWKEVVAAAIAVEVGIRVNAALGHGRAPVVPVAFGQLDYVGDPPVAE